MPQYSGHVRKLVSELQSPVNYALPLDDGLIPLNPLLGSDLSLKFTGNIRCVACQRAIKKSFNQGYCFPCFRQLAACDRCITQPELCHFAAGTCREPEWGLQHCMQTHIVYLANTSGLKVGITRHTQLPTRWIDQGAIQALPIFKVQSRYQSGIVETTLKQVAADKTNWRAMITGKTALLDMVAAKKEMLAQQPEVLEDFQQHFAADDLQPLEDASVTTIDYPVLTYPQKAVTLSFDKQAEISGTLLGIKGQYLLLDTGAFNLRKHTGYELTLTTSSAVL